MSPQPCWDLTWIGAFRECEGQLGGGGGEPNDYKYTRQFLMLPAGPALLIFFVHCDSSLLTQLVVQFLCTFLKTLSCKQGAACDSTWKNPPAKQVELEIMRTVSCGQIFPHYQRTWLNKKAVHALQTTTEKLGGNELASTECHYLIAQCLGRERERERDSHFWTAEQECTCPICISNYVTLNHFLRGCCIGLATVQLA